MANEKNSGQHSFGKLRLMLWPIHVWELKKFLPMVLMFFFISFNYTALRNTKDALIVTAPGSGAEAIPFLKLWGVLPFSILIMIVYAKLSNILSKKNLFYTMVSIFIGFFVIFSLFLYPNREILHPTVLADQLQALLPAGFAGLIAIFRNWTFALFYIMSELWGSVALSLLFWGFANDTTKISEAGRFYGVFGIGANVALVALRPYMQFVNKMIAPIETEAARWSASLNIVTWTVIVVGFLTMGVYWWLNERVLTDPRFFDASEVKKGGKSKPKMGLKDSFVFLSRSPYIGLLALLVIAYGVAINLVEVTWKNQVRNLFQGSATEYSNFMSEFSFWTGIVTIFMMLFVSSNVIRRYGWTFAALATPVVLLLSGAGFFSFIIFKDSLGFIAAAFGTTSLMIAVRFGEIQNIMSKSTKYSLFDPTKEMAYVPLDQESKTKGKAAIDVVGSRLGKSGGALVNQGLILIFGSISAITPYVGVILGSIILVWIWAARSLGKLYAIKSEEKAG
jgi:AAA family ATP:ADP antiporter